RELSGPARRGTPRSDPSGRRPKYYDYVPVAEVPPPRVVTTMAVKCPDCDVTFIEVIPYRHHYMQVHLGNERTQYIPANLVPLPEQLSLPYQCPDCGQQFSRTVLYRYHYKRAHLNPQPTPETHPHVCP